MLTCLLMCAAVGIPLGLSARQIRTWGIAALGISALLANVLLAYVRVSPTWADAFFLNSWISILGCAACVHLRHPVGVIAAAILSLNAGLWCGALNALAEAPYAALETLPAVAILWPVSWAVCYKSTVAVKVVASWLMAVALLAATLQFLPITPGYLPDHIE
jgi:hypothetical protein